MIQIHINPARVERVIFVSKSEIEDNFDFAAWEIIKPYINKMDRRLRQIVKTIQERSAESR